jgi:hypothetical protein
MKLHITILLSAIIIAAGLILSSRQTVNDRIFADDLLPPNKIISRADVINAVNRLDRAKLLSSIVSPEHRATDFRVLDAKASVDRKSIGIFTEVVLGNGTRSPITFGFERDYYGAWTATLRDQQFTLAL